MQMALLVSAVLATAAPAPEPGAATSIAKEVQRGSKNLRLSLEALCARLTLAEVVAVMGEGYQRRPEREKLSQACTYGDGKEKGKLPVRSFSLESSRMTEAGWRKFVEVTARGKVVERDGVLVSHLRRDRFGTDSVWFKDRQGHALELNVNAGVTEDQAVALAKAAMD
jgi:hypothetical protein